MLEADGIGFAFRPGRWLFRSVRFTVAPGEVTAVLGPNGRGKTTLLRCVSGLLRPTEGQVRGGVSIGYVPQASGVGGGFRVRDMVLMGRARQVRAYTTPSRRDHAAADAALTRVGLQDLADRAVHQLSGGERQLVWIARAMASCSDVLVLDEPVSALDLRNQERVLTLLRELASDGIGVLLTTHHPDHALQLADHAVLLHSPHEVQTGPAATLLTDGQLSRLYDVPVRTLSFEEHGRPRTVLTTPLRTGR